MNRKKLDNLVIDAIHLCKEKDHDKVSPALFQRSLMLDFNGGLEVFKELVRMNVISNFWKDEDDEDGENLIGEIDKNKIREFTAN